MKKIFPVLLVAALASLTRADVKHPNIVVFLSDDHSQLDSTVYGATDVKTPNMERVAKAGLVFDRAFVASPSCAPSRAAMLTGLTPPHNGAEPNHARPRAEIKKLPAYLQELGYEVVAFGKVGHYEQTKEYGFDLSAHNKYHEDICVSAGLEWLRARKSTKPLCLFIGTNFPHVPWPKDPESFTPDAVRIPVTHVDTKDTRDARTRYYAAIQRMDTEMGQVFDAAREVLGTDTFFLTSSDNGAQWPFAKWNCYEAGICTPMIAVWPGHITPGQRTAAMVSWLDILPTLVDVAGGPSPTGLDGRSFMPVLRDPRTTFRDRIFGTHSADQKMNIYPIRSVRVGDWKYVRNLHPEFEYTTHIDLAKPVDGALYFASWVEQAKTDPAAAAVVKRYHERPPEELYDLRNDPNELNNLAAHPEHAARLAELRAEVDAWMKANNDAGKVYGEPRLLHPAAK
jgi:arylsulfatase A-like enzyme